MNYDAYVMRCPQPIQYTEAEKRAARTLSWDAAKCLQRPACGEAPDGAQVPEDWRTGAPPFAVRRGPQEVRPRAPWQAAGARIGAQLSPVGITIVVLPGGVR